MSFTTQSASVPLVEATRFATGWPLIFTGAVSTSETNETTSGRPGRFALIVDQPLRPRQTAVVTHRLDGPRPERHGLGRIGHVLFEGGAAGRRLGEAQPEARAQVERLRLDRAAARAPGRPGRQTPPRVRAGLERRHGRDIRLRRAVLEVLVEERPQDLLPERAPGVAAELQGAERAGVLDLLPVVPGPHHEEHLVVGGVLRLERLVDGDGAVDVLLIPEPVHQHHRHGQRLRREDPVDGLVAPERVVGGVIEDLPPEADLFEARGVARVRPPSRPAGTCRTRSKWLDHQTASLVRVPAWS